MAVAFTETANGFEFPNNDAPEPARALADRAWKLIETPRPEEQREEIKRIVRNAFASGDFDAALIALNAFDADAPDNRPETDQAVPPQKPAQDPAIDEAGQPQVPTQDPAGHQAGQPRVPTQDTADDQRQDGADDQGVPVQGSSEVREAFDGAWETPESKMTFRIIKDVDTGDRRIEYKWVPGYNPSLGEVKLHQELQMAEDDIRRISRPQLEASFLFPIVDFFYPSQVQAHPENSKRLLERLVTIGKVSLESSHVRPEQATNLIRDVLADATMTYGMSRRWEIAVRFGGALAMSILLLFLARYLFVGLSSLKWVSSAVSVSPERSMLVLAYFASVSITAWASYMQRSMSLLERTPAADLEDLKVLLADTIHPAIRTAYIFTFSLIALVLLHLNVVTIALGEYSTADILTNFKVTVMCGLLLGLAERTLPAAMSSRATHFAGSLAQTGSPAQK